MKTLVKVVPKDRKVIAISEINSSHFIGVQSSGADALKGIVVKSDFFGGSYRAVCEDKFTEGNSFGPSDIDISKYLEKALKNDYKVFVFDSLSEAAQWLEEK